jgi:hypothetical protein
MQRTLHTGSNSPAKEEPGISHRVHVVDSLCDQTIYFEQEFRPNRTETGMIHFSRGTLRSTLSIPTNDPPSNRFLSDWMIHSNRAGCRYVDLAWTEASKMTSSALRHCCSRFKAPESHKALGNIFVKLGLLCSEEIDRSLSTVDISRLRCCSYTLQRQDADSGFHYCAHRAPD